MSPQLTYLEWDITNRAMTILRTLGARRAAGFLRNKGVSLEEALVHLGFPVRQGLAR